MQYKIYFTILLSISIVSAAPVNNNENQVQVTKYEYVTNKDGGYKFEFETSDYENRSEEAISRISAIDGTTILAVTGSFSYYGNNGKKYVVKYTSDEYGYKASYIDVMVPIVVEDISRNAILSLVG